MIDSPGRRAASQQALALSNDRQATHSPTPGSSPRGDDRYIRTADRWPDLPAADICVVVVSHNSADHLPGLVDSLEGAAPGLTLRVVVVDNDSADDSIDIALSRGAIAVHSGGNLGYSAGINVGRRWAGNCKAILVANPDLRLDRDSLRVLLDVADTGECVAVPRLLGPDRHTLPSLRREPTVRRQLGEALFGDRWPGRPQWLAIMERDPSAYASKRTTDWATGAALVIPAIIDQAVGAWDEDYFLYSEEVDFARRARVLGYPITYVPDAVAVHAEGGSGRSDRLVALDAVNRVRYFASWHIRPQSVVYGCAILLELILRSRRQAQRRALGPVACATMRVALGRRIMEGRRFVSR